VKAVNPAGALGIPNGDLDEVADRIGAIDGRR
jgi:hypothetical protein